MSKGLDLIKRQQPEIIDGFPTGNFYIGLTKEELTELENELQESEEYRLKYSQTHIALCKLREEKTKKEQAFEIIKKHPMFYLHDDLPQGTYRMYDGELYSHYDLTKEEYDLLAEMMPEVLP